ncbi:methyltransferase domain-containing protein [Rudaeicoccus suwonensis]|uniref:Trans-aconitate 2-methyltransferase n=1 Tax=Rudaeicoccus suwonensis TaxID=657409 RepID=A0A561E873_9MICO|nr:methyltransferase domain-containing protein [Rudaeicoccus suwonensis]TWE11807.1 trans-aconitate 2-methyltransferase [Rudaeicoccus suwonensis]
MATWDPKQYERFADLRNRPFIDLISRISAENPSYVYDLGCGNGPLTLMLAARWPTATVTGVDSSADMLRRAREVDGAARVAWQQADVADWAPGAGIQPDVIVTNATLQWVPGHLSLIAGWLDWLAEGGWFAMQVPGNFDAGSHRIIREVARAHDRAADLEGALREDPVATPEEYAEVLATACGHLDVWETTYLQILDPAGDQRSPVLEWVKGTALRPLLDVLEGAEQEEFIAELIERFDAEYPRHEYGVPFPFRRIFAVGRKGGF